MEKKYIKTIIFGIIVLLVGVVVAKFFPYFMNSHQNGQLKDEETKIQDDKASLNDQEAPSFINPSGNTMETRIKTPLGYERKEDDEGSFVTFLRTYPVKEDGSPILLYNGRKKFSQNNHVAVWKLPLEEEDLQQCADSVMRGAGEIETMSLVFEKEDLDE